MSKIHPEILAGLSAFVSAIAPCPCCRNHSDELEATTEPHEIIVSESAVCSLGATPNTITPTQAAASALLTALEESMLSKNEKAIYSVDIIRATKALHGIQTGEVR